MPGTQKSLLIEKKFGPYVLRERSIPEPGQGQVLVKVEVTGLNPADWKIQTRGFDFAYPIVSGCDISGVVQEIGCDVSRFAVGDRVLFQGNLTVDKGGFQEYTLVDEDLAAKIPLNISFEEAATIPATIPSGLVGLYLPKPHGVGLTPPFDAAGRGQYTGKSIVILGGSSSVGQNVIQLAKLSGFSNIVTTASLRNEAFLKSLGATHILDRHASPSALATKISQVISGGIDLVYDAVSLPETQQFGYDILSNGGSLVLVLRATETVVETKDKTVIFVRGHWGGETLPLAVEFYRKLTELLEDGSIKPNNYEVIHGGLNGVVSGLERLKKNEVSATKLLIRPKDTI
ncbi:hypothetical protein H0H93_016815 [Arthromyces matolae]|nr:hypothetical protein H0H93_016815 [Arthromyces matolae]